MKEIKITLSDEEYEKLLKIKGDRTWRELLLALMEYRDLELILLNRKFEELKMYVVGAVGDPEMGSVIDKLRVLVIKLIGISDVERRKRIVSIINDYLNELVSRLRQAFEESP